MGKKNKKRKRHQATQDEKEEDQSSEARSEATHANPLYEKQQKFLLALTRKERGGFFSSSLDNDRRAELWMAQADLGETLINRYSWATPDERSLRILRHFSPIVEIGCGANAYWSRFMDQAGLDVVAYDFDPTGGGKMNSSRISKAGDKGKRQPSGFRVRKGGPEVLRKKAPGRTLFLCYPDEDDEASRSTEIKEPVSMGAACLEYYTGDYVIHVGEVYGDTLAMDQAPWGRSSSPEFQQRLASKFHCILKAGLSNWLHVWDTISVWKRTETCSIVFAAGEDEEEEDEEIEYRYIPEAERMPADAAAPCLLHLLQVEENCGHIGASAVGDTQRDQSNERNQSKSGRERRKTRMQGHDNSGNGESISSETGYVCPW